MVDKILTELKDKLIEATIGGRGNEVSVGVSAGCVTMNNIVKADEILISDDEINIESGNWMMNFSYGYGTNIIKNEDEYCINNNDMELHICLIGT